MKFLKILYQPNNKKPPFNKQIYLEDCLVGSKGYSFAIPYSPQTFNNWLADNKTFRIFVDSTVKQLIMNNHKFQVLINMQDKFNLSLVDCDFKSFDTEDLLDGEKFSSASINSLLEYQEYQIRQVYFRTKSSHMITLKSNGVLGIDDELFSEDLVDIKNLIDFISFGPVIVNG